MDIQNMFFLNVYIYIHNIYLYRYIYIYIYTHHMCAYFIYMGTYRISSKKTANSVHHSPKEWPKCQLHSIKIIQWKQKIYFNYTQGHVPFNNLRGNLLRGAAGLDIGENLLKVALDPTSSDVLGHKAFLLICRHGVVFLQAKAFNGTDDENRIGFMNTNKKVIG